MRSTSSKFWLPARSTPALHRLVFALAGLLLVSHVAHAQEDGPTLVLRPHCEQQEENTSSLLGPLPDNPVFINLGSGRCHLFPTRDPLTRETPLLQKGATLDMDLVVLNPTKQGIHRVRAWIAYDPTILQGTDVDLGTAFPLPHPSELNFSHEEGYIKINASTDAEDRTDDTLVVARIRMDIIATPYESTLMSFYNAGSLPENNTNILRGAGLLEQSVLNPSSLGQLLVRLQVDQEPQTPAAESPPVPPLLPPSTTPPSPALPTPPDASSDVFALLRVHNVRATTEGSSVFLAWDPLPSAQLIGYNAYYGAVSGEYLQRRSVDSATTSLTLRSLPQNNQYYFALRGVSSEQKETTFSEEVSLTIGNPASSSAPLRGNILDRERTTKRQAHSLAGRTGTPSLFLVILLSSACVGTTLAFRRQRIASPYP